MNQYFSIIKQWFLPPISGEGDLQRRMNFLNILNLGWLAMGLTALVSLPFLPQERLLLTVIIVITGGTYLGVYFLNRRGKTRLAALIFVSLTDAAFYLFFMVYVFEKGAKHALATEATILMMMGLAIIFAGQLIGSRAPFGVAMLNSAILIITTQFIAPGTTPRFSIYMFWWLLALSVWIYERTLAKAFAQLNTVLDNQKQLIQESEQRNAELERFTYTVSHDLKSPLVTIGGFLGLFGKRYAGRQDRAG